MVQIKFERETSLNIIFFAIVIHIFGMLSVYIWLKVNHKDFLYCGINLLGNWGGLREFLAISYK